VELLFYGLYGSVELIISSTTLSFHPLYEGFIQENLSVHIFEQFTRKRGAKKDQGLASEFGDLFNRYLH
jgi:hypothetical protein